jgi:hypothetical protein
MKSHAWPSGFERPDGQAGTAGSIGIPRRHSRAKIGHPQGSSPHEEDHTGADCVSARAGCQGASGFGQPSCASRGAGVFDGQLRMALVNCKICSEMEMSCSF